MSKDGEARMVQSPGKREFRNGGGHQKQAWKAT